VESGEGIESRGYVIELLNHSRVGVDPEKELIAVPGRLLGPLSPKSGIRRRN